MQCLLPIYWNSYDTSEIGMMIEQVNTQRTEMKRKKTRRSWAKKKRFLLRESVEIYKV